MQNVWVAKTYSVCYADPKTDPLQVRSLYQHSSIFISNHSAKKIEDFIAVPWPSGLRRCFKAPDSSEAWVRIPPLPDFLSSWLRPCAFVGLRHRNFKFLFHKKFSIDPIYNPSKFRVDISTINRVIRFARLWRNDVTTSLRHRNLTNQKRHYTRLGPIYDPSKFG